MLKRTLRVGVITTEIVKLSRSLGRGTSGTITARISNDQREAFAKLARKYRCTTGELARLAILRASEPSALAVGSPPDPDGVLAQIAEALGLPAESDPAAILAAVRAAINPAPAPVAKPPVPRSPGLALSAREQAVLAKITDPKRRAQYLEMRANAARNQPRKAPQK